MLINWHHLTQLAPLLIIELLLTVKPLRYNVIVEFFLVWLPALSNEDEAPCLNHKILLFVMNKSVIPESQVKQSTREQLNNCRFE